MRKNWKIVSLAAMTLQPLISYPTANADVGTLAGLHTVVGTARLPDGSVPGITNIMVTAERNEATPTSPTPMLVLARGLSTPDGLFGLDMPLTTLTNDLAAGNSGTVNVVVTAVAPATADSAYWMSFATPLTVAEGGFVPVAPIELSMEQVPLEPSQTTSGPQPCGYEAREGLDYQYTDFAELHSWDDMTATLSNTFNASSSLDVGFSASGSAWRASGAQRHSEDKGGSNTATRSGRHGRVWQQKFEYEKLVAYYPGPDSTPPAYPIDCGSGQIVTRRIRATTPMLGFGEDASPEGDHSSYDGPAQYLKHKSPEKMADFSSGTSAHKHDGITNRYEAAATVFNVFTLGVVSEYSTTLGYDWEFGTQFTNGKSYHIWGETVDPYRARNVAAYAGPEPADNFVGFMKVNGSGSTNTVTVTGLDVWNGTASRQQDVSASVAAAPTNGTFKVYTSGVNTTDKYLRQGTYDVNVQNGNSSSTYGYTNHPTWNNPGGDCMTWTLDGNTKKVGTVTYNSGTDGVIDAAADLLGNNKYLGSGWAGNFSLPAGMNTSPGSYEQAVCIVSSDGTNGNMAPLNIT